MFVSRTVSEIFSVKEWRDLETGYCNMKLVNWPLMGGITFGTAIREFSGVTARPGPSSLYQM